MFQDMDQNVHNHLQKAPGTVISGTDCTNLLSSIPGATIHPQYNICTHDGNTGACYVSQMHCYCVIVYIT